MIYRKVYNYQKYNILSKEINGWLLYNYIEPKKRSFANEYKMEFKDYYKILGVTPETPTDDIKRAFRKLARQYHPDVSKLPDAEHRFKEINEAWEVLKDEQKRKQYDELRTGGWQRQPEFTQAGGRGYQRDEQNGFSPEDTADFSEFFNSIFGGQAGFAHRGKAQPHFRQKGRDFHVKIRIPLLEAYHGGVQTLQLQLPIQTPEGRTSETKSLNVKIPAGVSQGSQIRLKEQGGEGIGGGPKGDIYVEIEIEAHPYFTLHRKDVHLILPITPWEAALGATISVPTLGGNVNLKIPSHAQSGQKMRLKGRGLPGEPVGDQYVILQIQTPAANTEQTKALYEEMAKQMPFNPRQGLGV